MPSILVRFRNRAISQSSSGSSPSNGPSRPLDTSASSPDLLSANRPSPRSPELSRKILQDISGLLDSYTSEPEESPGLRPPRPRKRSTVEADTFIQSEQQDDTAEENPEDDLGELQSPRTPDMGSRSTSPGLSPESSSSRMGKKSRFSRFSPQLSSVSAWSTFGRNKERASPRISKFSPSSSAKHSRKGSLDSSVPRRPPSSRTRLSSKYGSITSINPGRALSRVSTNAPQSRSASSTDSRKSSSKYTHDDNSREPPSPPLTISSRHNSIRKSSTTRSSRSTQSRNASSTHIIGVESPRTFGNITPPRRSTSSGIQFTSASPFPPLPPLSHPELVAALSSRASKAEVRDPSNNDALTHGGRRWDPTLHGKTYPPRRRRRHTTSEVHDENAEPSQITTTFGRTLRGYSSLPRVQELFPDSSASTERRPSRASSRPRSTSSRRSSAEWSAVQATTGVTSDNVHEFGWPAEVSREILRLSLSREQIGREGTASRSAGLSANSNSADPEYRQTRRGGHVPRLDTHVSSASCFPALSPSPHLLGSLSSPSLLEASDYGDNHIRSRGDISTSLIRLGSVTGGDRRMSMLTQSDDGMRVRAESSPSVRQTATLPRTPVSRNARKSILTSVTPNNSSQFPEAGPSTPIRSGTLSSRSSSMRPKRSSSEPGLMSVLETPTNNKGKRKAEEVDVTPPDHKNGHHATFVIPENGRHANISSDSSRAPSSYTRKRARLSTSSPAPSPSRPGTSQKAANTGSWSSRTSGPPLPPDRAASRAASTRSTQQQPPTPTGTTQDSRRSERRHSMSEISIPISALIAPHAPSVSRSSTYHMRDPHRPPRTRPTSWGLHFKTEDEEGSTLQAWCFFIGFILFPIWWIVSFAPIPRTRQVGGTDTEKAVTLDDPQVEHDARSWRFRCRIMSVVSFFTYIPFIILLAIFVPR